MPQSGRTFRIFVSSTFSDLVAERNALQERVFPRLRELAMAHGCRFQAIDLRWGVSEEAALDQQTMKICLGEIERCQRVTPRPNFLILLGDRYGWRPLPHAIPAAEFEALLPHMAEPERALACWSEGWSADAQGWYRRDDNAVPAEYVLLPRQPGSRYAEYKTWQSEVERPLVAALERAARQAGLEEDALAKYSLSATGQEIVRGAMEAEDAQEHVFGFFRAISNLSEAETSARGTDFVEAGVDLRRRQEDLKARLRERLPGNTHEYEAQWHADCLSTAHIGTLPETLEGCLEMNAAVKEPQTLCEAVWLRLSRVILSEVGKLESVDPLQREQHAHNEFGEERARSFVGREEGLVRIAEYLSGSGPHPLAVWGESGCGKSALMARALQQAHFRSGGRITLVARFIGATPESSNGRSLLESLCRQITRAYHGDEGSIPIEYRDLVQEFPKRLALATAERPLLLFLDALDQLSDSDNARSLVWLPSKLPDHVKLVVSTVSGECIEVLLGRLPASSLWNVPALSKPDGQQLLLGWLDGAGRTLTGEQRADIMAKFELGGGLPLYLKLAFEEAKQWHAYDGLPALSDKEPGLSRDIPGVIRDLFWRLEQESNHGRVLVSHALGYLAAARNGLSEDELLDVLWLDEDVTGDFFRRSPQSPKDVTALPVAVWARLYLDLEAYLALRSADGAELLGFYHRQVAEAAKYVYLDKERHAGLAAYFTPQPLYLEAGEAACNLRKLSEMVYQQAWAGLAAQVEDALLHYRYLQAKLAGQGIQALIEDYALTPGPDVEGEASRSLCLLEGALRLSSHVLGRDPSQLPSQLTGRLLGFEETRLRSLLEQIRQEVSRPWLRPLHACLDAPGGALLRTLEGHTSVVLTLVVAPDGRRVVSGSEDGTIRVWDLASGVCLHTLEAHKDGVRGVAVTPDGHRIVSQSWDRSLKVWDLESGACLRTAKGYRWLVGTLALSESSAYSGRDVAVTQDGRRAVSGWLNNLKVWDLETGTCLRTLRGHIRTVWRVAVTPDGRRAVSGSKDKALRVWDLESGKCLRALRGHKGSVLTVVLTPDGQRVVSGSDDKTIKVWDLESGACLLTMEGHTAGVHAVAVTRDGRCVVSGSGSGHRWSPGVYAGDSTVKVWDLASGACLRTYTGHARRVTAVGMTPDGQRAVSGSYDKTIKVWDLGKGERGEAARAPIGHGLCVNAIAVTPDGQRAISGSSDHLVKVWDMESGTCLQTLTGHTERVNAVAVTPDGRRAVSASWDHQIKVWDLETGDCLNTLAGDEWDFTCMALMPDGRQALTEGMRFRGTDILGFVKVWDLEIGVPVRRLAQSRISCKFLTLTADGKRLLTGSTDRGLNVWDMEDGACTGTLVGHTKWIRAVAGTPDGRRAVSGSEDFTLKVWDLESGECLHTLAGHAAPVIAIAVAPDGRYAFSGPGVPDGFWLDCMDQAIRAWDLESGREICSFEGNEKTTALSGVTAGLRLVGGDALGGLCFLQLENVSPGASIITAWDNGEARAFGCPACRTWSEVPESALGTELPCPQCGRVIMLNPFAIDADWRPVAKAWRGHA